MKTTRTVALQVVAVMEIERLVRHAHENKLNNPHTKNFSSFVSKAVNNFLKDHYFITVPETTYRQREVKEYDFGQYDQSHDIIAEATAWHPYVARAKSYYNLAKLLAESMPETTTPEQFKQILLERCPGITTSDTCLNEKMPDTAGCPEVTFRVAGIPEELRGLSQLDLMVKAFELHRESLKREKVTEVTLPQD